MFSFPTRRLDLFYCFRPNVRRLFRRITRKGLLAPLAKRRLILKPHTPFFNHFSTSWSLNLMLPPIAGNVKKKLSVETNTRRILFRIFRIHPYWIPVCKSRSGNAIIPLDYNTQWQRLQGNFSHLVRYLPAAIGSSSKIKETEKRNEQTERSRNGA